MWIHGNTIELKLTNDFVCDSVNDINYVYITLYRNGKGLFTECVESIREEYEDTGTAFVPISCLSMKMNYASRLSTGRNSLTGLWMNLYNRENYN